MSKANSQYLYRMIVNSPLGDILIQGSQTHIQYLKFIHSDPNNEVNSSPLPDWASTCKQQLQQYFSAQRHDFDLPIDPQGTEFQRRVWKKLCEVKQGVLSSYKELASAIGNEKAVRAVASANAKNPIWLLIPCHRIIGSDLALRGYAGGIERKAKLLQLESHVLDIAKESSDTVVITEKTKVLTKR